MKNKYWVYLGVFVVSVGLMFVGILDDDAPGIVLIGFLIIVILGIILIRDLRGRKR